MTDHAAGGLEATHPLLTPFRTVLRILRTPPRWSFHIAVTVPAVALLWSHSVPGLQFVVWASAILVLLCFAGVWALRLLLFALRHRRWDWWFAVAPVAGLLVAASVYSALPLQVRFAASRPAFDRVISELPPPGGGGFYFLGSRQIGSYRIDEAHHVHGGVIFSEHNGDVFHNAGFAYLPDGPTPGLANEYDFEAPAWRHLGGPWYSWTATW